MTPQSPAEFFAALARLAQRDRTVAHTVRVGGALLRVARRAGSATVRLSMSFEGQGPDEQVCMVNVGLSFEQVDELCEALASVAPVPYVPELPPVTVMTS